MEGGYANLYGHLLTTIILGKSSMATHESYVRR